jgi:hypothetical protein
MTSEGSLCHTFSWNEVGNGYCLDLILGHEVAFVLMRR